MNDMFDLLGNTEKFKEKNEIDASKSKNKNNNNNLVSYPTKRGIIFDNVSFSHGNTPIFKNLNLHVLEGSNVALVGPSGTGKSTIFNLIYRL
mmetsp:Transcript_100553/g.217005  ORF Transcript_100553/g.217005 Transcript_100553/m.217005 type:complete len:92 (-) Transcript_100553:781-1056(-)